MTALAEALRRAENGLDWGYPCLIWVADYLAAATGWDPAEGFRHVNWTETEARASLARLAAAGSGNTAVERALDFIAKRDGWQEADGPRQGAVMIGVFEAGDVGVPAIFDGERRWIVSNDGKGWTSLPGPPLRMWEIAA